MQQWSAVIVTYVLARSTYRIVYRWRHDKGNPIDTTCLKHILLDKGLVPCLSLYLCCSLQFLCGAGLAILFWSTGLVKKPKLTWAIVSGLGTTGESASN